MTAPALLLLALLAQTAPRPGDDAEIVRGYYATAAYEEALAHIERLPPARVTPDLERYRALCLIALGRPEEGTLAFERLVRQAPQYDIPAADLPPRMLTMFRDVRQRVLPQVVHDWYARGRTAVDENRHDTAVVELRALIGLIDELAADGGPAFTELRHLADGFLRLAEAEMALAARAAALAEAPPPAPVPEEPPPPPANSLVIEPLVIYSRADQNVTPPVDLSRFMPAWTPPPAARNTTYRGELEIVVDEAGRASDARMLRPTHAAYDVVLVDATDGWRFEPARRDGVPVKYRLTFDVVLTPPAR